MRQRDKIEAVSLKPHRPLPRIHPNIAGIYHAKIQSLEDILNRPDDAREAAEAMRALIEKIVLTRGKKRGEVEAELHGELAAILALTSGQKPRPMRDDRDMRFSVIGERKHLNLLDGGITQPKDARGILCFDQSISLAADRLHGCDAA